MSRPHILIVEDDCSLADILDYNLGREGYEMSVARDGLSGLNEARLKLPDLIVLDLMLPVIDGMEICRRLRDDPSTKHILVLMLTAKSEEMDQVAGFVAGADDYVTKPFSVAVVLERIRALLRRQNDETGTDGILVSQGIMIDHDRHQVTVGEQLVDLTPSEFGLLESLLRQPGRVFSRSELMDLALGSDSLVLERTIDVHMRSLRKKLDEHACLLETVRGVGYRFRDPASLG